jgi:uncharacterized RmlC-like cupin family protein
MRKNNISQAHDKSKQHAHAHWKVVKTGTYRTEVTPQGHLNIPGVNDKTAGTTQLAANLVVMPPGERASGHVHHNHETIIFILEGWAVTFLGPEQEPVVQGPGEFLFIPMGAEHLPANLSKTEPVVGLVCRSDPKFYESLELLPQIDQIVAKLLPELQAKHEVGELPADWKKHYSGNFDLKKWKQVYAASS